MKPSELCATLCARWSENSALVFWRRHHDIVCIDIKEGYEIYHDRDDHRPSKQYARVCGPGHNHIRWTSYDKLRDDFDPQRPDERPPV